MREIVMKRENWDRGEILKIGRNNLISIAIFNFHHTFPHFEKNSILAKNVKFPICQPISAILADFHDYVWADFSGAETR